jgi:hypothetical protein
MPGVDLVPFFAVLFLMRLHIRFKWEAIRMAYPALE